MSREPVGTGKKNLAGHVTFYHFKKGRPARTLWGVDKQTAQAQVAGKEAVKRNRFIKLDGACKSTNRELEEKARSLAGLKAYLMNLPDAMPGKVIGAYHNLYKIEKAFRMAKSDLAARPVYHHLRESIEAHLMIVFAVMAVAHFIEAGTGWSIKKLLTTARRYRTTWIKIGSQIMPAIKPLSDDLREALAKIDHVTSR